MLNVFRTHHKKILWILAIIIIPAFVSWGGISYLKEKRQNIVAKIGGKSLTIDEFRYYITMAQLYFTFLDIPDKEKSISNQDIIQTGLNFALLLWKANKDKIKVSDSEVIESIKDKKIFYNDGKFDINRYKYFLKHRRMEPSTFENYERNFLKIDKLYKKYININPTESEVKRMYRKDTQKAKISYIFIPYDKLKSEVEISKQELERFYAKNKQLLEEEPKVKIKYAIIPEEDAGKINAIKNELKNLKNIDELKTKFSIEIRETGFIGKKDPIEGIGWQPVINKISFSLKKNKISPPLETNIGYIFLQKEDEKKAFIPELTDIKDKVENMIKEKIAKQKAKEIASEILVSIKTEGITNIKKIAEQKGWDFKETPDFKYYDYIEGLGLNETVSKIVFSLKEEQIYPYPIMLAKGAYILQLKNITPFDKNDFTAKKEEYLLRLKTNLEVMQKIKFLAQIKKEAKATF